VSSIATADGITLSYGYDGPLLKTTTWAGPIAGSVARTYDADFRLATETVAGGSPVTFGYDNDGLLTTAGASTITRDPATGFVSSSTLGGTTETRTYNSYGEEQSYTVKFGTTVLYSVDYGTRDALGRIVTKTETIQGETHTYVYGYDSRNRLSDVSKDGVATSHYDYDANGNRLTAPNITASPVYDAQDRLTSYGSCTYGYKPDGSLQTKTCPEGTTSYDYDAFGNLRHVTLPDGTAIDYLVDGQNRRIGKKVNGVMVEGFLYRNQLQPAAWLNGDGTVRARFIYGGKPNVPEYMVTSGGAMYRLVTDRIGTARFVLDTSSGAVIERIDWDEFGNVLSDSAPGTQPFGFAGGLRDLDTSLTRLGVRDYDSVLSRWTARDPLRFRGGLTNLYSYVAGDPINRTDPAGLSDEWPDPSGPPAMPWDPPACFCPSVPLHPPAASCPANIREAGRHVNPFWFYNQVRNRAPWDFKQQGPYEDFGNFNYGATGYMFGFPTFIVLRLAGWAQSRAGTSRPEFGHWWGMAPYGDDPADQAQIRRGIQYAQCGCGG
jgi:RHS repeat-associated protein